MKMKRVAGSIFVCTFIFVIQAAALSFEGGNWAILANLFDRSVHTIDMSESIPEIHGPFFKGQLGTDEANDVAVSPDNTFCYVSNYTDKTVYRINISNPISPYVAGSITLTFKPFDLDVSPNGVFALVSGNMSNNKLAIIELAGFTLINEYVVQTSNGHVDAVAIAADNKTVVICDHTQNRIIYGEIDLSKGTISESTLPAGIWPANVTISPDGKTVLVANFKDYGPHTVSVFQIISPGVLEVGTPPQLEGFPGRQDSIAFSVDGTRAFVVSDQPDPEQLSWLTINGPGNVSIGGLGVAQLHSSCYNHDLGVDIIATTSDGKYAVVGNSSADILNGEPYAGLSIVDLATFNVTALSTLVRYPQGVASFVFEGSPWVVVTNTYDLSISTINMATQPPTVYGPFLGSKLGSRQIYDLAVTPDGHYALVSNFYDTTLHRLDLSTPSQPEYAGSIELGFTPRYIAIFPDGQYALVGSGYYDQCTGVINLQTFSLDNMHPITYCQAYAIDIAADNQTVVVCGYYGDRIAYGIFDPLVGFIEEKMLPTEENPQNIVISPDGKTVIVCTQNEAVSIFEITEPGNLIVGNVPHLYEFNEEVQSAAFTSDGSKAYLLSLTYGPPKDNISWLQINDPGDVTLGGLNVIELLSDMTYSIKGADVMAITGDDRYALVGNGGIYQYPGYSSPHVSLVDLWNFTVTPLETNSNYPCAIAIFSPYASDVPSLGRGKTGGIVLIAVFSLLLLLNFRKVQCSQSGYMEIDRD